MEPPDPPPAASEGMSALPPVAASAEAKVRAAAVGERAKRPGKTKHERRLDELHVRKLEAEIERTNEETVTLRKRNLILDREIDRLKNDNRMRLIAGAGFFLIVTGWLIAVGWLLFANAVSAPTPRLSDAVLIAALGTTTANVLVLLYIVAKYLFPQPRTPEAKAD